MITIAEIKKILQEELEKQNALCEETASQGADTPVQLLPDTSFDNKVDEYLIKFEKETVDQNGVVDVGLGEVYNFSLTKALLSEADDENDTPEAEDDEKEEIENSSEQPIEDKSLNPVDVNQFAEHVARLVKNYNNLFDISGIVLRRSINFAKQTYGEEQAKQIEEILSQDFDLSVKDDKEVTNNDVPNAFGAGPELPS